MLEQAPKLTLIQGGKTEALDRENRRIKALEIFEQAIKAAQEARQNRRRLKSVIPLPPVEELDQLQGLDRDIAVSANATYYEGLMEPGTIKRKNKKGIFAEHRVEGRVREDPDVLIKIRTCRPPSSVYDTDFSASAEVRVGRRLF